MVELEVVDIKIPEGANVILGVLDGEKPLRIEGEAEKKERAEFLRKIGYKR